MDTASPLQPPPAPQHETRMSPQPPPWALRHEASYVSPLGMDIASQRGGDALFASSIAQFSPSLFGWRKIP